MSGGGVPHLGVPALVTRALDLLEKLDAFRERWANRMSRETDDLSKETVEVVKALMEYAKTQHERGLKLGRAQGRSEAKRRARVVFDDPPTANQGEYHGASNPDRYRNYSIHD